ncbi:ABC transporter substrate-binding protein [Bifidobacterium moukalabense]|jgi:raffinose/stachyose/melibiose transport system substrate-binding protein|uniref:ABC transporter substrate-binding protein n=1 Tax=Bifidobacterium moukalabense TaxID=1333651 RepID=UPI0010F8F7F8|nr:extracellular solute-binding protein [Bifidobacterium moukalabense]
MKFKTIAAASLAVATMLGMGACGSNSTANKTTSDGRTIITFWHNSTTGDGKAYFADVAKQFEASHKNVKIEIQAVQNEDLDGKLQTALQDPSTSPDVFFQRGGQKLRDMVDAGQLKDITKGVDASVKKNVGSAMDSTTVDGKVYGIPYTVTPGGIWYSKDLFAKAGITDTPTTWDELKADITKLKNAGITPVALGGKDAWPAAHWWYWTALRECSADVFSETMDSKKFDDKCWTKAGKDVKELLDIDAFNDGFLTTSAQQGAGSSAGLLANHKAAMEVMGAWEPGIVKDLTPDKKSMSDLGFFTFPSTGGQGDSKAMMGGADAFSVGANAPDEAVEFLNFLMNKENQEAYVKAFSALPANKEAQDVVTEGALKEALDAYNDATSYSLWIDTQFGSNVGNALNSGVVNMLSGKGSAEDIVKAATDAAAKG